MGVVGPPGIGGLQARGRSSKEAPLQHCSVGAGPLTWAPKLQQMQKSHLPSIQVFHTQKLPAQESSPNPRPPTSLTLPTSVALKTLGTGPLSAQPRFSLSCQYLLVTSHCHRQLVSSTSGSLPNTACAPEPARPGATSMRGSRLPSAERRSRAGILLPQEVLGGAASFCTRAGLQGYPPH